MKSAAAAALEQRSIARHALWGVVQNVWYGVSAASVLLLAAIGLAITFGVMGVINMAHGEMVMLGAYSTYVVQQAPAALVGRTGRCSRLPLAFLVAGAVGIAIERFVDPLSLRPPARNAARDLGRVADPPAVRAQLFGANNRQVCSPPFMSGAFDLGGAGDHLQPALDHRLAGVGVRGAAVRAARHLFGLQMRAVTQNRAHGGGDGHLDAGGRHARLRARLRRRRHRRRGAVADRQRLPNLGQGYIVDSFMVVVFGGVGNLWGTALGAMTLGHRQQDPRAGVGAVHGKIILLVFIILFIQKRPRGLFALKGRAVEA